MDQAFSSEDHPEYSGTYYSGVQGSGTGWLHRSLESFWHNQNPARILEIGVGSGEHLPYHRLPPGSELTVLDPSPAVSLDQAPSGVSMDVVTGTAESLPFESEHFDRVVMTCVLAHVQDLTATCSEVARVLAVGGEFAVAIPTDPGIANQAIKRMFTYRKLRRQGVADPRYFYAMQHRNPVHNILAVLNRTFAQDGSDAFSATARFLPLRVPSWNLNPLVVFHVRKLS